MLALELYCITPFGKIHSQNPEIIFLAKRIGRTPGAVALKMTNFAALDPTIDRKGMKNYSRSDGKIWEEFFADPAKFLDRVDTLKTEDAQYRSDEIPLHQDGSFRFGEDVPVTTTGRRNQNFFRATLLAAYNNQCALTRIAQTELLIASHILPWSVCKIERLNPRNGILLNALHDRAFDKGLITFEDNLEMITSKTLDLNEMAKPFFGKKLLTRPEKFGPDSAFLRYHRENIFAR